MSEAPVKGRRYNSDRRQQQAGRTRLQILECARELFIDHGYGVTTIADIAAAATVSVETVYSVFGSKAAVLQRVWDITIGGDDQQVLFHERPEIQALMAEPDLARRLSMWAVVFTRTARRMTPFIRAVQGAAATESAAAALLTEMGRQRLAGMTVMARSAAATGQLAVTERECRDLMWAMTDGALWHRLVVERGWSDKKFAQWLGSLWTAMLVRPNGARTLHTGP